MKKIIFSTILASFLFSNSQAQNIPNSLFTKPNSPIVTVGGFINFTAAFRDQEASYEEERLPNAQLNDDGTVNTANAGSTNPLSRSYGFTNDSEIYIKVGAISDSGLKYGAIVELEADTSSDGFGEGLNADKTFIFTESKIGKFEFGNNNATNQKMKVGPALFARATGGISGKYLQHVNLPMLADSSQVNDDNVDPFCTGNACERIKLPRFILIPQSPVAHGGYASSAYDRLLGGVYAADTEIDDRLNQNIESNYGNFNRNIIQNEAIIGYKNGSFGQMEDATKISYYTPRYNGWQLGVTFTPDTGDNGSAASISGVDSGDVENVISWGLNYSKSFGNLGLAFSATGEHGDFENSEIEPTDENNFIQREKLNSYDVGFMMTYFGFTIGGSYGFWGESLQPNKGIYSCDYDKENNFNTQTCVIDEQENINSFDDAFYYSAGLAYEFGPFATSLTHFNSEFQNNSYSATSFGIDYKLARGLMPYLEVTQFAFESNQPESANRVDQTTIDNNLRQLRDNKGFVGLVGVILSF